MKAKIKNLIKQELRNQQEKLRLIASENYASIKVMGAQGNLKLVDHRVEKKTIELIQNLFSAEYVNVRPYSGSQANLGVYFALLKPGDTIMGMGLADGGHLTHGSHLNISSMLYKSVNYGVDEETEMLNFQKIREIAIKYRPKLIICGASSYPRIIQFDKFYEIAKEIGALLMADIAHIAGLILAGLHPSPFPYADIVTATMHKTMRGPRSGIIMAKQKYGGMIEKIFNNCFQENPMYNIISAVYIALKEAKKFMGYQEQIIKNSKALSESFKKLGLRVVSGGTDNHLVLIDLTSLNITGAEAEKLLDSAGIIVNKNMIPFDRKGPVLTSGIRIGTPAVTTRGMKENEMKKIAEMIYKLIKNPELKNEIKKEVRNLCQSFPIYEKL